MTSANVDLVKSIYDAWARGDYSSSAWADPQVEFVMVGGPPPGRWTGLAGLAEAVREWLSSWQDFRFEAEDYREIDGERVLVDVRWGGRGRMSGVELGQMHARGATLFQIRDGRVTRLVVYFDRDRALTEVDIRA